MVKKIKMFDTEDKVTLGIIIVVVAFFVIIDLAKDYGFQEDKEVCLGGDIVVHRCNTFASEIANEDRSSNKIIVDYIAKKECYINESFTEKYPCQKWRDKTEEEIYCEDNPNDEEKCVCEEYNLEEDWNNVLNARDSLGGYLLYLNISDEMRSNYQIIHYKLSDEYSEDLENVNCVKARPKEKEEKQSEECKKLREELYYDSYEARMIAKKYLSESEGYTNIRITDMSQSDCTWLVKVLVNKDNLEFERVLIISKMLGKVDYDIEISSKDTGQINYDTLDLLSISNVTPECCYPEEIGKRDCSCIFMGEN